MVSLMLRRLNRTQMVLFCAVGTLLSCASPIGRVSRLEFWSAVLLAAGLVAIGYAMDWFVMGAVRLSRPDFFACFFGAVFVLSLLTLGARRLRDAGRNGRLILFIFVPVAGWLLLARWWNAPSGSGETPA